MPTKVSAQPNVAERRGSLRSSLRGYAKVSQATATAPRFGEHRVTMIPLLPLVSHSRFKKLLSRVLRLRWS